MSARAWIALVGAILTGIGIVGLVDPSFIVWWFGYAIANPTTTAAVLGEVRAVYGGLFAVIGVFTMLSAIDPAAHRERLVALGCCWLGLAGGRALGAWLDGSPGVFGWGLLVLEVVAGGVVVGLALAASAPPAAIVPAEQPRAAS